MVDEAYDGWGPRRAAADTLLGARSRSAPVRCVLGARNRSAPVRAGR